MKAGKSFLQIPLVSLGEGVRMRWEKKALLSTQNTFVHLFVCWWSLGSRLGNVNRTAVDIYEQGSLIVL